MRLTNDTIRYGYFVAGKIKGCRQDIDHQDIAHEAFVRVLRRQKPVPLGYECHFVKLKCLEAFRELFTNKTTRKHDVMLDAKRIGACI